jgi:hypothetical protein
MDSIEAQRLMDIANNTTTWGESWFTRDMNALTEARAAYQNSQGGDVR